MFKNCYYTTTLWGGVMRWLAPQRLFLLTLVDILVWTKPHGKCGVESWNYVRICTLWAIWKQRNQATFGEWRANCHESSIIFIEIQRESVEVYGGSKRIFMDV
eukprot:c30133_g1_i1 orf=3-308(-)